MTTYEKPKDFHLLQGKTIFLTGCSSGIGRATAILAYKHGANLALADWNENDAEDLISELGGSKERILFRKTDVSEWNDVLSCFESAFEKFGAINAVISNAGINAENLLDDELDSSTGRLKEPNLKNLKVNLVAHLLIVKCALYFFAKRPESRSQIVMTGSAASYLDTPPLYQYCAAKAGVLGLMRTLRNRVTERNVTVNMVAPWMTVTPMLPSAIKNIWGELPANDPPGIAHALLLPLVDESINGKSFFVAGNEIIELEDKIHEAQPIWMGETLSAQVDEGQRRLIPVGSVPDEK